MATQAALSQIRCVSFSADGARAVCGFDEGFALFSVVDPHVGKSEPLSLVFSRRCATPISHIAVLDKTGLVAVVGSSPLAVLSVLPDGANNEKQKRADTQSRSDPAMAINHVAIWHQDTKKPDGVYIAHLEFRQPVLGISISAGTLVIAAERTVWIYELTVLKLIQRIDTAANPGGACLSRSIRCPVGVPDRTEATVRRLFVAAVGPGPGQAVLLASRNNHKGVRTIPKQVCHSKSVARLAIDRHGRQLAVGSRSGTVVRVYEIVGAAPPSTQSQAAAEELDASELDIGDLTHNLRRGSTAATLRSLAFNAGGNRLAVTSDTTTLHIYKLHESPYVPLTGSGSGSSGSDTAASSATLMDLNTLPPQPRTTTEMTIKKPAASGYLWTTADPNETSITLPEANCACTFVGNDDVLFAVGPSGMGYLITKMRDIQAVPVRPAFYD